ncbi:biotin--[acetyl-CoA-carboxylase] ligase [Oceanospirillum linum]|uniref:Bifunctional ligase/repressor BirA n=1 Tax=Oceanospirillum linum TaxID=966 RepID=A0A1T1H8H6_OCELI|nr:biotin--[acetyl-CoA-carboxylase] ligase [Oceanospirillum linum]OOV86030.1 biotin--[acetyl-CoA-carboxylase] ligase [Oceanospirillum linum]SEG40407.1 BirA family transcriptional regulator, biotin operon repressor / biotin-[acetyl-CoA-carboxylase] ligase [Oleiphilus messinensis]SMP33932.1 BirA family transcriptional regulator, biotin operon repressor / biotin-[acetyl-CoA-carboxylase] ligase [Oceanospirillum linum]
MDNSDLINYFSDGEWHSGVQLAELLGVSRAAIWKRIQKLEAIGLRIEREQSKGYRLKYSFDPLDKALIKADGLDVQLNAITGSTNTDAQDAVVEKKGQWPDNFSVVLAEQQTAGRGRRGRNWLSPYGANLYMSCAAALPVGAASLETLSLEVGISVAQVLEARGVADVKVKWPNDVYADGSKLAGILIEVDGDLSSQCNVVIGIGINFTNSSLPQEGIDQPFTAVDQYTDVRREEVATALIRSIYERLDQIVLGKASDLLSEWERYDFLAGKPVTVFLGALEIEGVAEGLDGRGNIQVRLRDGTLRTFAGGEVSVRAK